jgi:hypothetical protein
MVDVVQGFPCGEVFFYSGVYGAMEQKSDLGESGRKSRRCIFLFHFYFIVVPESIPIYS